MYSGASNKRNNKADGAIVMKRILTGAICILVAVPGNLAWSEDLATITLDEALVFAAPDGDVVNVAPGRYTLELAVENNRSRL